MQQQAADYSQLDHPDLFEKGRHVRKKPERLPVRHASRKDGQGTIRAATPARLLDAIKDDAGTRPFTTTGNAA